MQNEDTITIHESAVKRVNALRASQNNPGLRLRITVEGGGCSGFQYRLELSDRFEENDRTFGGGAVVTDEMSMTFLKGATVTFEEGLIGAEFRIDNPNAVAGCGCGTSFSIG
ncbi:MAG: iron-sulfur cluster assembly accessory protein [Alphaproteobacteria bacterium]|nr:iron-sulfur cluster assembly accessory protein [Alphaproteobacteria bacterium]